MIETNIKFNKINSFFSKHDTLLCKNHKTCYTCEYFYTSCCGTYNSTDHRLENLTKWEKIYFKENWMNSSSVLRKNIYADRLKQKIEKEKKLKEKSNIFTQVIQPLKEKKIKKVSMYLKSEDIAKIMNFMNN